MRGTIEGRHSGGGGVRGAEDYANCQRKRVRECSSRRRESCRGEGRAGSEGQVSFL